MRRLVLLLASMFDRRAGRREDAGLARHDGPRAVGGRDFGHLPGQWRRHGQRLQRWSPPQHPAPRGRHLGLGRHPHHRPGDLGNDHVGSRRLGGPGYRDAQRASPALRRSARRPRPDPGVCARVHLRGGLLGEPAPGLHREQRQYRHRRRRPGDPRREPARSGSRSRPRPGPSRRSAASIRRRAATSRRCRAPGSCTAPRRPATRRPPPTPA